jgi:hypothetical protein
VKCGDEQFARDWNWSERGIYALIGMGVEPGLSDVFAKYASEVDDWEHECYFIRDSNFTDYTRELAEDCYDIPLEWPFRCIDWKQASEELKCDYSAYDFGGVTYWIAA